VAVSLDSTLVALGSRSGDVKVFIHNNGTFEDTTKELADVSTSTINAVAFSPDNQYIVVGIFDGDILLWDWNNNPDAVRGAFGISVFGAAWSPV
jgi:WD40 repeat protein